MNRHKPGDLAVSISRISGSGDTIRLEVEDRVSGASIVAEMTLADFALAITGRAMADAKQVRTYVLDKWGQQIEYRHVSIKVDWSVDREAFHETAIRENCPEGFVYSHGGYRNDSTLSLTFARWGAVKS